MFSLPEGEILLKETNGNKQRYYVKPPEQTSVVVYDEGGNIDAFGWFAQIFLPHGYPHSVSKDYATYQIWDTAQAFCSTITGTLATQEVLRGVGVGDISATPLAATITWIIKDGCGHIGRIFFAYTHGTQLDAYSKKWRLYADVLNDAAMCIEISLPLFKNYTTFALCVSTTMKAIVGVAGGATRAALTQHHALRGNLADVSAKDSAQETAVNLIASLTALLLIVVFGNSVSLFLFTMVLHITFNYLAVRAVCLKTLNEPRYLQVISSYVIREVIASPCEVNRHEPIVLYQFAKDCIDVRLCGYKIKMGCSIQKITKTNPRLAYLNKIKRAYLGRKYMLYPNIGDREMYVLLRESAGADDVLCAYFHAVLLAIAICAVNGEPLVILQQDIDSPRPFVRVCQTLQAADWSRDTTDTVGFSGFVYEPSADLMRFMNDVVQKEWRRFKTGLTQTGWDINKHLLLSEEWRISCHAVEPNGICSSDYEEPSRSVSIAPDSTLLTVGQRESGDLSNGPFVIEPDEPLAQQSSTTFDSRQGKSLLDVEQSYSTIQKDRHYPKTQLAKPDSSIKQETITNEETNDLSKASSKRICIKN